MRHAEREMSAFNTGDRVVLSDDAQENDQYQELGLIDAELVVTGVAYNRDQHPGYDEGLGGQALYDLAFADGRAVAVSLYEYELRSA